MMKKLLCVVLLAVSGFAQADGFRHHGRHHHHEQPRFQSGDSWIAPVIIGGIIGYEISRQQQPVIVYPPVSSPPYPPHGYHYEQMLDAYCNCYRIVLVQN
jgi:hypothetical protein